MTFARSPKSNEQSAFERIVHANATSIELGKADRDQKGLSILRALAPSRPSALFVAATQSMADLDAWSSVKEVDSAQKMVAVEVSCAAPDSSQYPDIETTLSLIKHAHKVGIQVLQ